MDISFGQNVQPLFTNFHVRTQDSGAHYVTLYYWKAHPTVCFFTQPNDTFSQHSLFITTIAYMQQNYNSHNST